MESRTENMLQPTRNCSRDSVKVLMAYDGSGRRMSKTRMRKAMRRSASPEIRMVPEEPYRFHDARVRHVRLRRV